ncbi:hypothetical protein [Actibacterium sp. MT2.3-13A]|uniref:hypothetical protein n=1 Tax=Actibacterium sp. MT2.3-13A TaxID=2828332 RepID=UPI001BA9CF96|nr:hypothetical protein [Actibacterium sp. MT2.3-13A]
MLQTPTYLSRRPRLFIDVQHGLCNRLRAMASAASIAARTGRELVVIWRPDHHCAARLSDLLAYDGPVIEDGTAELCRRHAAAVWNYMEIEPGSCFQAPILAGDDQHDGQDVYIRSAYTLNSPHRRLADEQRFLRALRPTGPVLELVAGVRHPNRVAAHVRMGTGPAHDHLSYESPENWPAHRHAELTAWRQKSHARHFMTRIDALIAEGRAETIFLAADLPETYTQFAERYGARLAFLPRDRFDRSVRQLQYALADLLLLTAADLFLASSWSSFSELAQRLARPGRPFEQSGRDF